MLHVDQVACMGIHAFWVHPQCMHGDPCIGGAWVSFGPHKRGQLLAIAHNLEMMEGTQEQKEEKLKSNPKYVPPSLQIVEIAKRVEVLEGHIQKMEAEMKSTITCRC